MSLGPSLGTGKAFSATCKNMSRVTLDELLEEVGVSPAQLDKACTSEHLQDIALFLESWRTVAPHLGLSNVEAEEVENDGRAENEKRRKILEVWKARFAFKAKYLVLIKALLKIGRADQAEQVCRVLVPQRPKEGTLLSKMILHGCYIYEATM